MKHRPEGRSQEATDATGEGVVESSQAVTEPAAVGEAMIVGVDVGLCAIPMPHAVRIGDLVYPEREYAALRVRTRSGVAGMALGHTRNVPLVEALERVAPSLLGRDALRRSEILGSLRAANLNGRGSLVRAFALVDIALWDVLARSAGLPLWRLLGGSRRRVPLIAVGGYFSDIRSQAEIEEEIRSMASSGFRAVKVPIEGRDPVHDAEYVAHLQRAAGPRVSFGVDAHMAWQSLAEAIEPCRRLDDLGLAFIEDPFPPDRWRLTRELQARLRTPVAVGEDALHLDELRNLVDAATILRVDATASGGIGVILDAIALAVASGRGLMTHAFPELHAQLAGGVAAIDFVEMLPYESGANPVGELLARRPRVIDGELLLDEEPGHGLLLDWDAIARRARRASTVDLGD